MQCCAVYPFRVAQRRFANVSLMFRLNGKLGTIVYVMLVFSIYTVYYYICAGIFRHIHTERAMIINWNVNTATMQWVFGRCNAMRRVVCESIRGFSFTEICCSKVCHMYTRFPFVARVNMCQIDMWRRREIECGGRLVGRLSPTVHKFGPSLGQSTWL